MRSEKGFTLIELMIGLILGLIVLSAVIYAFISSLRSSADVVNSTRLNREISTLNDVLVGELRRAGYWPVSGAGDSPFGAFPDLVLLPSETAATCVLYSFYNDAINPAQQIYRGIGLASGALYYDLSVASSAFTGGVCNPGAVGEGWVDISNPNFQTVSMSLTLYCTDIATGSAATGSCAPSAGKTFSRAIDIGIESTLVRDPAWSSSVQESVKVQNDLSN